MTTSTKKIPLMEMFGPTIQGEGALIGQQTYFMRFGLCDYKCTMCDSMHAVDPRSVKANAQMLTQQEIWQSFRDQHNPRSTKWITFSGGNPCIHDLSELVLELRTHGFQINTETQGTMYPDWLDKSTMITISPKGPGMGEETDLNVLDQFYTRISLYAPRCTKIVVFDQRDLEFAKMIYERYPTVGGRFYLSLGNPWPPNDAQTDIPKDELASMLMARFNELFNQIKFDPTLSQMRFLPQMHVLVWGNARGK